jgi:hypothetical protein
MTVWRRMRPRRHSLPGTARLIRRSWGTWRHSWKLLQKWAGMTRKTRKRKVVRKRTTMRFKKLVQARNLTIKASPKKFSRTRIPLSRSLPLSLLVWEASIPYSDRRGNAALAGRSKRFLNQIRRVFLSSLAVVQAFKTKDNIHLKMKNW